jgi:hypothetical protein
MSSGNPAPTGISEPDEPDERLPCAENPEIISPKHF